MYELKTKTKEMAAYMLGMSYESFTNIEYDEMEDYEDASRRPSFSAEQDERIIGRGSVLLARKEFLTMEEVNKGLLGDE